MNILFDATYIIPDRAYASVTILIEKYLTAIPAAKRCDFTPNK